MSTKVNKNDIRRKKAITKVLYLPADEDQAERFEAARQRHNMSVFAGKDEDVAATKEALDAVKAEIHEEGLVLTFRAVGRKRFDEIINEHPPTEAQKAEDAKLKDEERRVFDPAAFWPALLSETVLSDMTAEEWQAEVFESPEWNSGELRLLRDNAQAVNTETRVVDLGN